jgi:hypothetical protein
MSIKRIVRGVVATLTIVGGASAAAALPASAATLGCGPHCISVFSSELGSYAQPNFVEHVFGGIASIGQPTGLNPASGSDPSEDFINPHPGDVSDYYAMGLVSAAVNQHYGPLTASQLEYAPSGMPSGLCVGVATDPFQGEALTLQSCTVPGRTVWIIGSVLSPTNPVDNLFPIVSGATANFARPFVMSYPPDVNPSALPPIRLRHLRFLGNEHTILNTQLWGVKFGLLQ